MPICKSLNYWVFSIVARLKKQQPAVLYSLSLHFGHDLHKLSRLRSWEVHAETRVVDTVCYKMQPHKTKFSYSIAPHPLLFLSCNSDCFCVEISFFWRLKNAHVTNLLWREWKGSRLKVYRGIKHIFIWNDKPELNHNPPLCSILPFCEYML